MVLDQARQYLSICACAGSAIGLKAGSQLSGVCLEIGFSEMELCRMGWAIGGSGSRSPLMARLTEMVTTAALSAVTGLVNELMPPAMKQLKRQAAARFFSLLPDVVCIVRS